MPREISLCTCWNGRFSELNMLKTINSHVFEEARNIFIYVCTTYDFITFMNFEFLTHINRCVRLNLHTYTLGRREKWDVVYSKIDGTEIHTTFTCVHMTNDGAIKWFCALNCTVLFINNNFKYVIIYSLSVCVCFRHLPRVKWYTLTIFFLLCFFFIRVN